MRNFMGADGEGTMSQFDAEDEARASLSSQEEWDWSELPATHRCPVCNDRCRCMTGEMDSEGLVREETCQHNCGG